MTAPEEQKYEIHFIAGGVVKDADGNVLDDSSERAARAQMKALGIDNLLAEDDN